MNNFSDHIAIKCEFDYMLTYCKKKKTNPILSCGNPLWRKASETDKVKYRECLDVKLAFIDLPIQYRGYPL